MGKADGLRNYRRNTAAAHYIAVERTVAYMRQHLSEPLDLDALSFVAAMSKYHFARTFLEITGTTPNRFLGCLRIERAKQLLLQTDADVTEICMAIGYSSLGSFSSTFTELVGLPPSMYRRLPRAISFNHFFRRAAEFLETQNRRTGPFLDGEIDTPVGVRGFVFVGAFSKGVPQGAPESGTVILESGRYRIPQPSTRSFHLLAVQLPYGISTIPLSALLPVENVASAWVPPRDHLTERLPTLSLRPIRPTDPPLVVELLTLL